MEAMGINDDFMSKCPHTNFRKGQRLIITMLDGFRFIDKFVEGKSGVMILKNKGRTNLRNVRAITIFRGQVI